MTTPTISRFRQTLVASVAAIVRRLERVPYAILAIPLRVAVATVFWRSAMTKLANWDTAVALFVDEYKVPLLPPELAAYVAVTIELTAPVLLVAGLFTRVAALILLAMTAVIEIFVYPLAWPTHIQWAAMLLILLCRGPGKWSLDDRVRRHFDNVDNVAAGASAAGRGRH